MLVQNTSANATIVVTASALAPQYIVRSSAGSLVINSFATISRGNGWASEPCFVKVDATEYLRLVDMAREQGAIAVNCHLNEVNAGRGQKTQVELVCSSAEVYAFDALKCMLKASQAA